MASFQCSDGICLPPRVILALPEGAGTYREVERGPLQCGPALLAFALFRFGFLIRETSAFPLGHDQDAVEP